MSIEVLVPSKKWASEPSSEGVPLAELSDVLGALVETELAAVTVANNAGLSPGLRLTGNRVDAALHDSIRVGLYRADGTLMDEWIIPDIDPWLDLLSSAPGDTLVRGSTALEVVAQNGSGNLLIGRSGGNRVFIEASTPGYSTTETNFQAKAFGRGWSNGLLDRRLGPLRGGHPKDIVFKIKSAAKPVAPIGYTIDASTGDATPGSDGYVLVTEPDPAGSDALWNAAVHNPVDSATGLYRTTLAATDWIIYPVGSTYRQEFTDDREDPKTWVAAPPGDTDYLETRIRDEDGNFHTYVIRDYSPWSNVVSWRFRQNPGTAWLNEGSDWSDADWIQFIFRQERTDGTTQGNRRVVNIPADLVKSVGMTSDGTAHEHQLNFVITDWYSGFSIGPYAVDSDVAVTGQNSNWVKMWIYGAPTGGRSGTRIRLEAGYITQRVYFTMRAL